MFLLAESFESLVGRLIDRNDLVPVIVIGGGVVIALFAIVFSSLKAVLVGRAQEQTRREIAAYVAEGSIDPDKAVAMLESGRDDSGC